MRTPIPTTTAMKTSPLAKILNIVDDLSSWFNPRGILMRGIVPMNGLFLSQFVKVLRSSGNMSALSQHWNYIALGILIAIE